jgi:hypothetical protein
MGVFVVCAAGIEPAFFRVKETPFWLVCQKLPVDRDYEPASLLTTYRIYATPDSFSLMRGVFRRRSYRRSEAWRPVADGSEPRCGRYGTQSVRSCDRAGGQVATWIRWTLPELKRGPAAGNRHGGAPRGVVPIATGWLRVANAASRLASVIEDPVWRLAALRRPPRSGTVQGKETIRAPNAARKREVMRSKRRCVRWKE